MRITVSLPGDDVRFLDEYAKRHGLDSRSAAIQRAVRLLRTAELGGTYEAAWGEWVARGEADVWEQTTGDGIGR